MSFATDYQAASDARDGSRFKVRAEAPFPLRGYLSQNLLRFLQLQVSGSHDPDAGYPTPATYSTAAAVRDEALKTKIAAAHATNYGVFGARKVWLTLNPATRRQGGTDRPLHRRAAHG